MLRFIRLALLLACGALLGSIAAAPGDEPAAKNSHTIVIKGFQFVPDRLDVAAGDTITWKNEDIVPHTATAKRGFNSKEIGKGGSWTYVASKKGAFPYICSYHPTMHGEVTVR